MEIIASKQSLGEMTQEETWDPRSQGVPLFDGTASTWPLRKKMLIHWIVLVS